MSNSRKDAQRDSSCSSGGRFRSLQIALDEGVLRPGDTVRRRRQKVAEDSGLSWEEMGRLGRLTSRQTSKRPGPK